MASGGRSSGGGWLKKLVIGVVALGLLAVGGAFLAVRLIDWEKVRKLAEERGSAALGRPVEIQGLTVSLLSGVEVRGFKIGPAPHTNQPALVQADKVLARYRLLPLLWLSVVIDKVELVEPRLAVGKDRRGRWSFADLVKAGAPPSSGGSKPVVLPVGVDIRSITITKASLRYTDASVRPAFSAGVENLNVQVGNFSLTGAPARLKVSLTARMDKATIPIEVEGNLGIALNRSLVTLTGFAATLPGIKAVADGTIREFQTLPTPDLVANVQVDLGAVWTGFAGFIPGSLKDMLTPAGGIDLEVKVSGTATHPAIEGTATARGAAVRMKSMPGVFESAEGKLRFTDDLIATDTLRFISLDNPFTVECDIRNLQLMKGFNVKTFAPRGKFVVTSPKVVLDRFMPPILSPAEAEAAKRKAAAVPPAPEPDYRGMIPVKAVLDGEIRLDEIHARKILVSKERAKLHIAGGNVSYEINDELYGGQDEGSGKVLITKYPVEFQVRGALKGVKAEALVNDGMASFMSPSSAFQGRITGVLEAGYDLAGRGITFPSITKSMKGSLHGTAADGHLSKLPAAAGLAKTLKLGWLDRELPFKTCGGSYGVAAGVLTTSDTVMEPGPDGDLGLLYKGTITFAMMLKGELTTRFHPRHADEVMTGDVGKLLFVKDAGGWAVGAWDVSGPMTLPTIIPSKKNVAKRVTQEAVKKYTPQVQEQGKKLLDSFLKKKK